MYDYLESGLPPDVWNASSSPSLEAAASWYDAHCANYNDMSAADDLSSQIIVKLLSLGMGPPERRTPRFSEPFILEVDFLG